MRAPLPPILVVDDNPDELFLTLRLLRHTGTRHPLVPALSGGEAIERLRKSCLAAGGRRGDKPAVVFLDVNMPLLGGFDVLRWIRRKQALREVKVIMLSSSDDAKDTTHARRLGADGYLIKFPSVATLTATLREAVEGIVPCPPEQPAPRSPEAEKAMARVK